MREGAAGRACIVGEANQGPFDLAGLLLGMESWLIALVTPEQHAAAVIYAADEFGHYGPDELLVHGRA